MAISKGDQIIKTGRTPGNARIDLVRRIDGRMVFHYYPGKAITDQFTYVVTQGKLSGTATVNVTLEKVAVS